MGLKRLTFSSDDLGTNSALLVGNFRGIPLASWLDLILEYAVLLARSQNFDEAYEVVNLAKGANVFYSSVESMFLIHTCWFSKPPSLVLDSPNRILIGVQHVL